MHNYSEILSDKADQTQYLIHDLLRQRWSPYAFSTRMVESEKLHSVLEAASWAASSYNEQPCSFIVATSENQVEFERLLSILAEGNQEWARNAPILMISIAKLNFEYNGVENRHAFHDVGAASTTLAIQAANLGLFIYQMAGFDVLKTKELYHIPSGYEPVSAIALGYFGDPQTLSEKFQQRENALRSANH